MLVFVDLKLLVFVGNYQRVVILSSPVKVVNALEVSVRRLDHHCVDLDELVFFFVVSQVISSIGISSFSLKQSSYEGRIFSSGAMW